MEPGNTLKLNNLPKSNDDILKLEKIPYQNAIGALIYVLQATRPDLSYCISTLSKFNKDFDPVHWEAFKKVFRYLKGTMHYRLCFTKNGNENAIGYSDSSWQSDPDDYRSVTGYVFKYQGAAVSWNCKRQSTIALSSTEAEYYALTEANKDAIWIRSFILELNSELYQPILINCDNKGAIDLSKNSNFGARTKHITLRHSFLKDTIDNGIVQIDFVPTQNMLADPLTKAVPKKAIEDFTKYIGLN